MGKRNPHVLAIVQARMGSTRLPGKVLMKAGSETVLARVVRRLARAKRINQIVVATTLADGDLAIVDEAAPLAINCFRGSEHDVLERYSGAAAAYSADVIVRVTSDCPLIDPALVDEVIHLLATARADFACNVLPRRYPRGLDTEAFTREALEQACETADQSYQREHVTPIFYERRDLFRFAETHCDHDYSQLRWTVDTAEDLEFIRAIYQRFDDRDVFGWKEVLALLEKSPELSLLNSHVQQKPVLDRAAVVSRS
jgi:spore coat polysaccharide biosynthesis protein SpsF